MRYRFFYQNRNIYWRIFFIKVSSRDCLLFVLLGFGFVAKKIIIILRSLQILGFQHWNRTVQKMAFTDLSIGIRTPTHKHFNTKRLLTYLFFPPEIFVLRTSSFSQQEMWVAGFLLVSHQLSSWDTVMTSDINYVTAS